MELFDSFLKTHPPGSHHNHSFYYWVNFQLPEILANQYITSESLNKSWKFSNVRFVKPHFTNDCIRALQDNFRGQILVDIVETDLSNNKQRVSKDDICIAEIPCPVEIEEEDCLGEYGSYFWIRGLERVLVTQIRSAYNTPLLSKVKEETKKNHCKEDPFFTVLSKHQSESKTKDIIKNTWDGGDIKIYQVTVRSLSESSSHSCKAEIYLTQKGQYMITSSKLSTPLPCFLVLKALGCVELNHYENVLKWHKFEARRMYTYSMLYADEIEALECLSKIILFKQPSANNQECCAADVLKFLVYELFPHLGLFATKITVATYIGQLIVKLIRAEATHQVDNRDSLIFKRFEAAGSLVGELFEQTFKKWITELQKNSEKKDNLILSIDKKFITSKIMQCFSNGIWGDTMPAYQRTGVSAIRTTTNYLGKLSQLYRASNPISKETKNLLVRQLDNTHLHYICPCESPEGHTVGIVLNLAQSTKISVKIPTFFIMNHIKPYLYPVSFDYKQTPYIVSINGKIVGCVFNAHEFITIFKNMRQQGMFDSGILRGMVSIGIDMYDINIYSDEGRLTRPVKTSLYDGSIKDWNEALIKGHVQWLDPYEQEYSLEAFVKTQNIHESLALGVTASQIPFINYQHAPRGVYASNMNKQAISSLGLNQSQIYANNLLVSFCQNVPIVSTCSNYNLEQFPLGNNVLCGICPIKGYNQEDAIVFNRQSLQNGLFSTVDYRTFLFEEVREAIELKIVECPSLEFENENVNFCMINDEGYVNVGEWVEEGDVLISGFSRTIRSKIDCSVYLQRGEEGYVVEAGVVKVSEDGSRTIRVVVASEMTVVEGDKFASRYAQKGVVGKIVDWWELPTIEDGSVCDIYMSPLALPSRMTCPTLYETVVGNKCLESGTIYRDSLFTDLNFYKEIFSNLDECLHTAYLEGQVMRERLFAGPMYYMRLMHLASKKCYARSIGVMSKYVRQPTDGRSRNGGLRLGEMEKNVLIGYAASNIIQDRLFDCSDKFFIDICRSCKNYSLEEKQCFCGSRDIVKVKCAFSTNLLFSQLRALGGKILLSHDKPNTIELIKETVAADEENESDTVEESEDEDMDDC